jgi:hypothetical protein
VQSNVASAFFGDDGFLYIGGSGSSAVFIGTAANPGTISLTPANGTPFTIQANANNAGTQWVLPINDGAASNCLSTDGFGNLFWLDPTTVCDPLGAAAAAQAACDPAGSAAEAQAAAQAASEPLGSTATAIAAALPINLNGVPLASAFAGATGAATAASVILFPFVAGNIGSWGGTAPSNLQDAIDRLAACLALAVGNAGLVQTLP